MLPPGADRAQLREEREKVEKFIDEQLRQQPFVHQYVLQQIWSSSAGLQQARKLLQLAANRQTDFTDQEDVRQLMVRQLATTHRFYAPKTTCAQLRRTIHYGPNQVLQARDLPTPNGFLYFDQAVPASLLHNKLPGLPLKVRAIIWREGDFPAPGQFTRDLVSGVCISFFERRSSQDVLAHSATLFWQYGSAIEADHRSGLLSSNELLSELGEMCQAGLRRVFLTLWRLITEGDLAVTVYPVTAGPTRSHFRDEPELAVRVIA